MEIPKIKEIKRSKKRADTALILVTFNQKEMTSEYLNLLNSQTTRSDVIIVDQNSQDGTFEEIGSQYKDVTLIKTKENYGGAGGYYLGQRFAFEEGYEFIILSENDVFGFDNRIIEDLLSKAREDPSKIYRGTNSLKNAPCGLFHFTIIHRNLLKRIGYIDHNYFFRGDDAEYGLRIQSLGIQIETIKNTLKHPVGGGALKNTMPLYFITRNELVNFRRYKSKSSLFKKIFLRYLTHLTYKYYFKDPLISQPILEGIRDFAENKISLRDSLKNLNNFKRTNLDYSKFQIRTFTKEEIQKNKQLLIMGDASLNQYFAKKEESIFFIIKSILMGPKKKVLTVSYGSPGGLFLYFLDEGYFIKSLDYEKDIFEAYYLQKKKNFPRVDLFFFFSVISLLQTIKIFGKVILRKKIGVDQ